MAQKAGTPPLATLADDNGTPVTVTGGALATSATLSGPVDTELPAAALIPAGGASNISAPQVNAMMMALSGTNVFPVPIINPSADGNPTAGGLATTAQMLLFNGTDWDRVRGDSANGLLVNTELPAATALGDGDGNPTAPKVGSCIMGIASGSWYRVGAANNASDAVTGGIALNTISTAYEWDGANLNRRRSTQGASVLASASRTTTQTQADQTNYNWAGLILTVDVTAIGTGSITPKLQGKNANGVYYDVWVAAAAITANGTKVYQLYPGATGVGAMTEAVALVLPAQYRVVITANNANAVTYSVATSLNV